MDRSKIVYFYLGYVLYNIPGDINDGVFFGLVIWLSTQDGKPAWYTMWFSLLCVVKRPNLTPAFLVIHQ